MILGNDPRSLDAECLGLLTNADVLAVQQDALVMRGSLVWQVGA